MNKIYIYIVGLMVIASSCTEPIELDLNSDNNIRLVVDGFVTTDTTAHVVDLSLTKDYFGTGVPAKAEGAVVSITNGTNVLNLTEVEPGKYYTPNDYFGLEGESYTLDIDYDGQSYSATTSLPTLTPLDSIAVLDYEEELGPGQEEENEFPDNYSVVPFFQEPSTEGNFYIFKMLINGEYFTETLIDWLFTGDEIVNGSYIRDAEFFSFYAEPGDEITFEMFSITKSDFENLNAILLETEFRGGLFDGAPANVPSNVSGGAVGQFIMADVERKTVTIE